MRPASCCILLALAAACAEPNDGPTIIVDNPESIPFQAPQITKIAPVAGTAAAFDVNFVMITGVSLNLKADLSDNPTITVALTRDLAGVPEQGQAQTATVQAVGVQRNSGVGAVKFLFSPPQPGLYSVTVKNAAGSTTVADAIAVVPELSVTPPVQRTLCGDHPQTITLDAVDSIVDGNFLGAGNAPASVDFVGSGGEIAASTIWSTDTAQCVAVPLQTLAGALVCSQVTLDYPANAKTNSNGAVLQHAVVTMEDTFERARPFDLLFEYSSPEVSLANAFTDGAAMQVPVSFTGAFLIDGQEAPAVTLDGAPVAAQTIGCAPTGVGTTQFCSTLQALIPAGTQAGVHALTATSLTGCTAQTIVPTTAPPVITSITPGLLCKNSRTSFEVAGTSFIRSVVLVDGKPAPNFTCSDTGCTVFTSTLQPGTHQLAIRSFLQNTADSAPVTFSLEAGPAFALRAHPETLLAGAGRQVFVPLAGKTGVVRTAELQLQDGSLQTFSPEVQDVAGGALVTMPIEAPAGQYFLTVLDDSPCPPSTHVVVDLVSSAVVESFGFDANNQGISFAPFNGIGAQLNDWLSAGGNPGGAVFGVVSAASAPEYFRIPAFTVTNEDLSFLRFDLEMSSCAAPDRSTSGLVQMTGFSEDTGISFTLSRPLDPPACGSFTHYDVPLDASWTYLEDRGTPRAATPLDFTGQLQLIFVPGNFSVDGDSVILDNVVLELGQ